MQAIEAGPWEEFESFEPASRWITARHALHPLLSIDIRIKVVLKGLAFLARGFGASRAHGAEAHARIKVSEERPLHLRVSARNALRSWHCGYPRSTALARPRNPSCSALVAMLFLRGCGFERFASPGKALCIPVRQRYAMHGGILYCSSRGSVALNLRDLARGQIGCMPNRAVPCRFIKTNQPCRPQTYHHAHFYLRRVEVSIPSP